MSPLAIVLLILLLLLVFGGLPLWPYAAAWGYYPSGLGFILLVVLIILIVQKRL